MRVLAAALVCCCACAGDPAPPAEAAPLTVLPPEAGVLRLAGSGAMIPLVRVLAAAWQQRGAPPRVVVEESLGSAGGVAAAHDGAVDVGLVSRALQPKEAALGLVVVPAGADAVVIAANPSVPVRGLGAEQLRQLYSGEVRAFPDGSAAAVLLRDRGESANRVLEAAVPGIAAAPAPTHPWRVVFHDSAMIEAIAATPNAIGVTSLGLLVTTGSRLPMLELDGKRPGMESLLDGSWPMTRPLAFVMRADRAELARPFLEFVASEDAAALFRESGYRPEARR